MKRIIVFVAVVLSLAMLTATVAFAGNGYGSPAGQPTDQPTDTAAPGGQPSSQPSGGAPGGQPSSNASERQQFMEQIRSLVQQVASNRNQIRTMRAELSTVCQQARVRLGQLKDAPGNLTDEQIEALQTLTGQLRQCRNALGNTNPGMAQQRQTLRQVRRSRDYEAIIAAYGDVLRIQQEQMDQLSQMTELQKQICDI